MHLILKRLEAPGKGRPSGGGASSMGKEELDEELWEGEKQLDCK